MYAIYAAPWIFIYVRATHINNSIIWKKKKIYFILFFFYTYYDDYDYNIIIIENIVILYEIVRYCFANKKERKNIIILL